MNASSRAIPEKSNRIADFFIVQAWLVLLLASLFGAALAGIQLTLAPKIEANKLNETLEKVPELVFGAEKGKTLSGEGRQLEIQQKFFETGQGPLKKTYSVFEARENGRTAGWVAKASGQGYADKIELLVGVDAAAQRITGLFILDQKETPGLGNKIMETEWRGQFIEKAADDHLTAVKTKPTAKNEIQAITGATISSKAVCDIVNQTLNNLRRPLKNAADSSTNLSEPQQEQ